MNFAGWRKYLRATLSWAQVMSALVAAFGTMIISIAFMFPIGGGLPHLLFAYSEGGSLAGQRVYFVGLVLASMIGLTVLRRLQRLLRWQFRAALVGLFAAVLWMGPARSAAAGPAFRLQAIALAPILVLASFGSSRLGEWRREQKRRRLESLRA